MRLRDKHCIKLNLAPSFKFFGKKKKKTKDSCKNHRKMSVTDRIKFLVGKSRDIYKCNHVVNYALTGNTEGILAAGYLKW